MVPGSIMPPYPWLEKKDLNFEIQGPVASGRCSLPYGDKHSTTNRSTPRPRTHGRGHEIAKRDRGAGRSVRRPRQLADKQVIALIAYLQRLGTDI